ncbi:hypothetical protein [Pararhizobium mangrovi]|uniref:Uncharacterized protein n=1 Tax=Pararhizobium mangrovi TaxID=2590452 RepID=A0A506UHC1_9HYPH|nr:hypothetical protein [Pararhizobium mangrovi]TPW32715.1 hypothetical protein FJU11_00355 [Pararhizobium mangrovi]
MADFVAVIRKAVNGLAENTPETRERVYTKARSAIRRQLEGMSPPPSEEVVARQMDKLDAAIREVELEHTEALPAEEADTGAPEAAPEHAVRPPDEGRSAKGHARPAERTPDPAPVRRDEADADIHHDVRQTVPPYEAPSDGEPVDGHMPRSPFSGEPFPEDPHGRFFGPRDEEDAVRTGRRRRGVGSAVAAVVILLIVAGAAYGLYTNRERVLPMVASLTGNGAEPVTDIPDDTAVNSGAGASTAGASDRQEQADNGNETTPDEDTGDDADAGSDDQDDAGALGTAGGGQQAGDGDRDENGPSDGAERPANGSKFTQRLKADGSETDPGPATADDSGEARSVTQRMASLEDDGNEDDDTAAAAPPAAGAQNGQAGEGQADQGQENAGSGQDQSAISQKMYLYEERFKDQAAAATTGNVVWSLARDSDAGQTNTPVIRGQISLPDKGITAMLTIKRNSDDSLPASHLVEIVFALPGDFAGGGISSVRRVSMKQTEESQGDPLVAVPAKITDDFFMVALNDYPQAIEKNLQLLKSREWIDIPIVYTNGRRALLTLDKGSTGAKVFDTALAAWKKADEKESASASGGSGSGGSSSGGSLGNDGSDGNTAPPASR